MLTAVVGTPVPYAVSHHHILELACVSARNGCEQVIIELDRCLFEDCKTFLLCPGIFKPLGGILVNLLHDLVMKHPKYVFVCHNIIPF